MLEVNVFELLISRAIMVRVMGCFKLNDSCTCECKTSFSQRMVKRMRECHQTLDSSVWIDHPGTKIHRQCTLTELPRFL